MADDSIGIAVSHDEHESGSDESSLVAKPGDGLTSWFGFRRLEASFGDNLSLPGTSNRPGRRGA